MSDTTCKDHFESASMEGLVLVLAAMSDELRTPLNAVIGCSSLLSQGLVGDVNDEQRTQLDRVTRSGEQLLSLVRNLIDAAGSVASKLPFAKARVDLCRLVQEQCDCVRPILEARGVALIADPGDRPIFSIADESRVQQILCQLLSNAIRYTDSGVVRVRISAQDGFARVDVSDTGPGVPAVEQSQLFRPFARIRGDERAGVGLGLAISKRFVKAMGGRVGYVAEDVGSRFWFTLPLAEKESA